jgi:hypothetical protein
MTPHEIKDRLVNHGLDEGRVTIERKPGYLETVVTVDALTENEHDNILAFLHQAGERAIKVVRREVPEKPRAYDLAKLNKIVRHLGTAPDTQLDEIFTKRIRELSEDVELDEMLKFIRNLRDECVFGAGASGFVMTLFNCLLEDYPEPEDVKKARRAELERKYGM